MTGEYEIMKSIGFITFLFLAIGVYAQSDIGGSVFIDSRDGKEYRTVTIGDQVWFAENLDYKPYAGSCTYQNDISMSAKYGRLYTWEAAHEACPSGWHLPDEQEWQDLEFAIGLDTSELDEIGWRGTREGNELKSKDSWDQDGNGSDAFGFSAMPAGFGDCRGGFGSLGRFAYFWSSTEYDNQKKAWIRKLYYPTGTIGRSSYNKSYGFSVRCVKDRP